MIHGLHLALRVSLILAGTLKFGIGILDLAEGSVEQGVLNLLASVLMLSAGAILN